MHINQIVERAKDAAKKRIVKAGMGLVLALDSDKDDDFYKYKVEFAQKGVEEAVRAFNDLDAITFELKHFGVENPVVNAIREAFQVEVG